MAGVTIPLGLETPIGVEKISVALLNRNSVKINDAIAALTKVEMTSEYSASVGSSYNGLGSKFIRIKIGSVGIIVADVRLITVTTRTLPDSTPLSTAVFAPAGYKFKTGSSYLMAPISGLASNGYGQMSLSSTGEVFIRRAGTNSATFTAGTTMSGIFVGEWDGAL